MKKFMSVVAVLISVILVLSGCASSPATQAAEEPVPGATSAGEPMAQEDVVEVEDLLSALLFPLRIPILPV